TRQLDENSRGDPRRRPRLMGGPSSRSNLLEVLRWSRASDCDQTGTADANDACFRTGSKNCAPAYNQFQCDTATTATMLLTRWLCLDCWLLAAGSGRQWLGWTGRFVRPCRPRCILYSF